MLPDAIKSSLTDMLSARAGEPISMGRISVVGGGCINESFRVETSHGEIFLKYNDATRYPGMFASEAKGLQLLAGQWAGQADSGTQAPDAGIRNGRGSGIRVPDVIGCIEDARYSALVLAFLDSGRKRPDFWEDFGNGLAQLHKVSHDSFGLDFSNYIGCLPQSNKKQSRWIDFFVLERLEAQLKIARDSGHADRGMVKSFGDLYPHLPDFFPEEPPALLHGDLWSGNYMTGPDGQAAIVDPAVYFGHRYMDLGMSKLFGGFAPAFYRAYEDAFAMEKNWQQGIEIANLYPLMVHVNLFGGGYTGSVRETLRRFKK